MAPLPEAEKLDVENIYKSLESGKTDLLCVLGPTASGKTRLAVQLAGKLSEKRPAEIISADSRQVYRGMTIGTGKDLEEYGEIPYHLIDIAPAGSRYNIYEYQRDFEKVYKDILDRGCIPVLCGGSGLYIETVTQGYSLPEVPADPKLREKLEKEDTETLIKRLSSLKTLHNSTDYDTRKRVIRAIEIAVYEQSHPAGHSCCLPKDTYYIGTLVDRDERNRKIDARLDARLEEGLVEEVRSLIAGGITAEDLMYYGLEYKFVTQYILGELDFGQMRDRLATAIHQFAKRQMTWFRGMERRGVRIHWVKTDCAFQENTDAFANESQTYNQQY